MKKIAFVSTLALTSLLTFSSLNGNASAATEIDDILEPVQQDQIVTLGAGSWDAWFGNPDELTVTPGYTRTFSTVSSGGGNYKVRINANKTGGKLDLTLYESDGSSVQKIKTITGLNTGDEYTFTGISDWVDGDNKKAELFINVYSHGNTKSLVSLSYWD